MGSDIGAGTMAIAAADGCPQRGVGEAAGLLQAAGLDVYVVDDAQRPTAALFDITAQALLFDFDDRHSRMTAFLERRTL